MHRPCAAAYPKQLGPERLWQDAVASKPDRRPLPESTDMHSHLFSPDELQRSRPERFTPTEWALRMDLAACYRVFFARGWSEEIFNHITLRVPGPEPTYLINPFGLHYGEVTAQNLIKVDLQGRPLHDTPHLVNRAGFVIHSAIHAARADAHCIIHTHDSFGLAVACKAGGLAMNNFYAAFLDGSVAYHDFEGVTTTTAEQPRLVASLGDKRVLVLRNHGLLVAEASLPAAFYWYYVLQRACHVQALAQAMEGATLPLTEAARAQSSQHVHDTDPEGDLYPKVFAAAVRRAGLSPDDLAG
jgi:ribulose-5-phosphate 4-epimerase/fuculose-1-phosphate aldolase